MCPVEFCTEVDEERLVAIIADCMERQDQGETIDRSALFRDHPDFAKPLLEYFDSADLVERLASSVSLGRAEDESASLAFAAESTAATGPTPRTRAVPWHSPSPVPNAVGRYQILDALGRGGMGTVYLARDTKLDRKVALKLPQLFAADDDDAKARFLVEARAAAQVRHRHICRIYDYGEIDGTPYYTMDLIEGERLTNRIGQSGFAKVSEAVALVITLARAMQHPHELGILHRDLKPANIIIDGKGEPVIVDFGLAHDFRTDTDTRLTETGVIIGTIGYVSPEQIGGKQTQPGPGMDIWSLGIILHELLTGRLPFRGSRMETIAQILRDIPQAPSQLRREIDPQLDAICLKMLDRRPENRYSSMAKVAVALEAYLRSHRESPSDPLGTPIAPLRKETSSQPAPQAAADSISVELSGSRPSEQRSLWFTNPAVAIAGIMLPLVLLFGVIIIIQSGDNKVTVSVGPGDRLEKSTEPERESPGASVPSTAANDSARNGVAARTPPFVFEEDTEWREVELATVEMPDVLDVEFVQGFPPTSTSRLLAMARPKSIEIYDPYSRITVYRQEATGEDSFHSIVVGGNGTVLAAASEQAVSVWKLVAPPVADGVSPGWKESFSIAGTVFPGALTVSRDGRRLAIQRVAKQILLLNANSGEQLSLIKDLELTARQIALSPDGFLLAVLDSRPRCQIFETETGKRIADLPHVSRVKAVAFSHDMELLATADSANDITIWDLPRQERRQTLSGHGDVVTSLAFSPDSRSLVSGSEDRTVRVWDLEATQDPVMLNCHGDATMSLSPNGDFVVACEEGRGARIWAAPASFHHFGDMRLAAIFHHPHRNLTSLHVASNLGLLAVVGRPTPEERTRGSEEPSSEIVIWDLKTRAVVHQLTCSMAQVTKIRFSPDGRILAALGEHALFEFWDVGSGQRAHDFNRAPAGVLGQGTVRDFDFLPGGELLVMVRQGVQLFTANTFEPLGPLMRSEDELRSASMWSTPHSQGFVTGSDTTGTITLFGKADTTAPPALYSPLRQWNLDARQVTRLKVAVDGQSLLVRLVDRAEVWDLTSPEPQKLLTLHPPVPHRQFALASDISADGSRIVLVANTPRHKQLHCYHISGRLLASLDFENTNLRDLCLLPDGEHVVTAASDGSVMVLRLPQTESFDREAAQWVIERGGRVILVESDGNIRSLERPDELPSGPFYVRDVAFRGVAAPPPGEYSHLSSLNQLYKLDLSGGSLADEAVQHVKGLPRLGVLDLSQTKITDAAMPSIAKLRNLVQLSVSETRISGEALPFLISLRKLQRLDLSGNNISDDAMAYLRGLPNLTDLNLRRTPITDAGISHLHTLKGLRRLWCGRTFVTAEGVRSLQDAIPQLTILLND